MVLGGGGENDGLSMEVEVRMAGTASAVMKMKLDEAMLVIMQCTWFEGTRKEVIL